MIFYLKNILTLNISNSHNKKLNNLLLEPDLI